MNLQNFPIGVVLFGLVIVAMFSAGTTFWGQYGYTPEESNMDTYNTMNKSMGHAINLYCDINPEADTCTNKHNALTDNIIARLAKGGYDAFLTMMSFFNVPKVLIETTFNELQIPPIFATAFFVIILIALLITIIIYLVGLGGGNT